MLFKPPHYLNPVPRIYNHLLYQLFFHILGQLVLFQKQHHLLCLSLGAILYTFFRFLRLLKCCKLRFHPLHIGIIFFLLIQEKLPLQLPIRILVIQYMPPLITPDKNCSWAYRPAASRT